MIDIPMDYWVYVFIAIGAGAGAFAGRVYDRWRGMGKIETKIDKVDKKVGYCRQDIHRIEICMCHVDPKFKRVLEQELLKEKLEKEEKRNSNGVSTSRNQAS